MRDNEVVYLARAFAQQAQLDQAINELVPTLGPDVVRLRYSLVRLSSSESSFPTGPAAGIS
jgi:hypothetical protein